MPKRDLHDAAEDAVKVTPFDRLVTGALDSLGIVPAFGPLVAGAFRQVVPQDHLIYLGEYFHEVADRINALEAENVDRDHIGSDAWQGDVERCFDALGFRRNREKRQHYVAALANASTVDRPQDAIRLRYFDVLESLRPSHLELLAVVATANDTPLAGGLNDYLTSRLVNQDLENIKLDWNDLERAGILDAIPVGMAMTPVHERYGSALRAFGARFAVFVEALPENG